MKINYQAIKTNRQLLRGLFLSQKRGRRPLIEIPPPFARRWLALDCYNSFLLPKACMKPKLKGERFRFFCVLMFLAARYGNPFNYTDREMARNFGFHLSRIPDYKNSMEEMGLVCVALARTPNLKWPKSFYLIFEFWNYDSFSSL